MTNRLPASLRCVAYAALLAFPAVLLTPPLHAAATATRADAPPADVLWNAWPHERFVATAAPCLLPGELDGLLRALTQSHPEEIRLSEVGRSVLDRPIHLIEMGHGRRKVMLWSQMHGDEPSATPALLDLAHYFAAHSKETAVATMLRELTLLIVPMVNPDGADAYTRRNAQWIDINRDALSLATPEGRLLKKLRDEHQPLLGFNLHDQNRRVMVGNTGVRASHSLLGVAGDEQGTMTPGRALAKRAAAAMFEVLATQAPGGIARYDEDWSPRAFGDNLTAWGTPVVLLESGAPPTLADGTPGDLQTLTRLNFAALTHVLLELGQGDLDDHDATLYENLPRNQRDAWADVILSGGALLGPDFATPYRADLAWNLLESDRSAAGCGAGHRPAPTSRIAEVGDARFLWTGERFDATGTVAVPTLTVTVDGWKARHLLADNNLRALAQHGVSEVRWLVPPRQLAAATRIADAARGAQRARVQAAATTRAEAAALRRPFLELRRPLTSAQTQSAQQSGTHPGTGSDSSFGELLRALAVAADGMAQATEQDVLRAGWSSQGLPLFVEGGRASFVLLRGVGPSLDKSLGHGAVEGIWIDGQRLEPTVPATRP